MAGLQGKVFSGYQLAEQVNGGGIADVYRAHPKNPGGREAIVKVIHPEFAQQKGFLPHFREIVKLSQRLANHPHILPLLASGEEGGYLYLVTPYVAAGTLKDWIARGQRLGPSDTLPFFRQLCDALGYAHSLDIVHSNLKPSNIFLFEGRHVLLGDFGMLLDIGMLREFAQMDVTHSAEAVEYLAPEVASGKATHLSDIYSVGAVLCAAITGQAPFRGATLGEVLAAHERQPVPHLQQLTPGLSPAILALDPVTQRALAKKPGDRFPSAAALSLAIESSLRQAPAMGAAPQSQLPPPGWPPQMSTALSGAALSGAAGLGIGPGIIRNGLQAVPEAVSGSVLQTLNPPFPPLPSSAMVDETMEHGRVNMNPVNPMNPSPTEVQTARVPAPRTLVRKETDLRPTLRVPAPQPPPASEQAGAWNQVGRGDVSMLPAISPASLRQLAAQRENTSNTSSTSDIQNPPSSAALPPQPPYTGQGSSGIPFAQWPPQLGLPAPGAQAPIPASQGYNGGYSSSLAELPHPDYGSDYTGERDAYEASREDETGRYQASRGWNSDEYSGEYTGAGYGAVGDSRELDSWNGEESIHDRYADERDFSPTALGLPHLTNPGLAAGRPAAWQDSASGALPRDSRGQRAWDSGAARGGEDFSSDWGGDLGYNDATGDSMQMPGFSAPMLAPGAAEWPDMDALNANRRMRANPMVPFEDQKVWTNSLSAIGRHARWVRWLIPVILLLVLADVGLVAVVRPDLCPENSCQVISAKAHQLLPFMNSAGSQHEVALSSTPSTVSLKMGADKTTTQTVQLTNTGSGVAHWTAVSGFTWLTLDSVKGTLGASRTVTLTVTANSAGIHPQTYTAAITITAGGKILIIPVTVMVTS